MSVLPVWVSPPLSVTVEDSLILNCVFSNVMVWRPGLTRNYGCGVFIPVSTPSRIIFDHGLLLMRR